MIILLRKRKSLNKENRDEISFMSFIIPEFAAAYTMNVQKNKK